MKDLCTILEDATKNMGFPVTGDDTIADMPFASILALAEEKYKDLFSDINDETPSY